jgi:hypothetical protein
MLGSATSQEEFLRFIRGMVAQKADPAVKPFVVMDNAGGNSCLDLTISVSIAHHSLYCREELNRSFQPFFQPGYR